MSQDIPNWLNDITDPRLRDAALVVWQRLPEPARVVLEAQAPEVLTEQQAGIALPERMNALTLAYSSKPGETTRPRIVVRAGLDDTRLRWCVGHELAHVLGWHWLLAAMQVQMSEAEQKCVRYWLDALADYMASELFGLRPELDAIVKEVDSAPVWYRRQP